MDFVLDQAAGGLPVRIAAPAVLEIAYGYQRMVASDQRYDNLLSWFAQIVDSDLLSIVALDGRAAFIAGRLRGVVPHPPGKRDTSRSKTINQASWLLDIEIAATAYAAGLDVATENRRDFEALSRTLSTLFPAAPTLAVFDGPT